MKKAILIALMLMGLASQSAFSQPFVGLKLGTDAGIEAGFTIANMVSIKGYMFTDYTSTLLLFNNKNTNPYEGNRYHLTYGGGIGARIVGPVWLVLDVGYGWGGRYTIDPVYETRARKNNAQGIELGFEGQWYFTDELYLSAGYFTIPAGFKYGAPVHCAMASIGVRF